MCSRDGTKKLFLIFTVRFWGSWTWKEFSRKSFFPHNVATKFWTFVLFWGQRNGRKTRSLSSCRGQHLTWPTGSTFVSSFVVPMMQRRGHVRRSPRAIIPGQEVTLSRSTANFLVKKTQHWKQSNVVSRRVKKVNQLFYAYLRRQFENNFYVPFGYVKITLKPFVRKKWDSFELAGVEISSGIWF